MVLDMTIVSRYIVKPRDMTLLTRLHPMFDPDRTHPGRQSRRHHRDDYGPTWLHDMRDIVDGLRQGRPPIRRGDVRPLILAALARQPMHGYQVIGELEAQSGGRWRPSAGSVYPTLQQLEDEGLVRSQEMEGRRTYSLTDEGRTAAAATPPARPHWIDPQATADAVDIRRLAIQLAGAVMQVDKLGSAKARQEARVILVDARRKMYRILADDVEEAEPASPDGVPEASA
jgi:DNA-binding PadR family transcriptional regulator